MSNQVLQSFYHRMMPLYTPQAEKFVQRVDPAAMNRLSFRYTFSVQAMTKISYIIEDAIVTTPRNSALHTSFQKMSRVLPQMSRYRNIAQAATGLWLYGVSDMPLTPFNELPRTTLIDTNNSILVDYWFVVAYGPGIGMSLLAEEVPSLSGDDRYYEGFYTFEQDVAYQIIHILHQIYPQQIPQPLSPEQFSG
jgi:hypothetical protein